MKPIFSRAFASLLALAISLPSSAWAASSSDSFVLLPTQGRISGSARIDRDTGKNEVIGSWKNAADWVQWSASFPAPGVYDVFMSYSESGANPGSTMELAFGDQGLQTRLEDTSNWDNPCYQYVGQIQISRAGIVPVRLSVVEKRGFWVMSMRLIRISRSESSTLQEQPLKAVHPATP